MRWFRTTPWLILLLSTGTLVGARHGGSADLDEKPFVILIASYNNATYARDNITSAITQRYSNYRVIFINDCSSDRTLEIVQETVEEYAATDRVTIVNNQERKLGLRNYCES